MHLQVPEPLRSSTQESIGLPDCAFDCFNTVEPDASKWGCTGDGYACLCGISWFFAGYNICARESCTADDLLAAEKRIQSHCDVLNKRNLPPSSSFAQATALPSSTSTSEVSAPSSPAVVSTQIATTSVTSSGISFITQTPAANFPEVSLISVVTPVTQGGDTTSSTSGDTSTPAAGASESTPPTTTSTATSTSPPAAASPSSTQAPSGLSQSAKIGIGLGVPLGVIVLALLGYVLYRFGKKSGKSRGNNNARLNESGTEKGDPVDVGAMDYTQERGELHGQHVVHHPKELPGSPRSVQRELP